MVIPPSNMESSGGRTGSESKPGTFSGQEPLPYPGSGPLFPDTQQCCLGKSCKYWKNHPSNSCSTSVMASKRWSHKYKPVLEMMKTFTVLSFSSGTWFWVHWKISQTKERFDEIILWLWGFFWILFSLILLWELSRQHCRVFCEGWNCNRALHRWAK